MSPTCLDHIAHLDHIAYLEFFCLQGMCASFAAPARVEDREIYSVTQGVNPAGSSTVVAFGIAVARNESKVYNEHESVNHSYSSQFQNCSLGYISQTRQRLR